MSCATPWKRCCGSTRSGTLRLWRKTSTSIPARSRATCLARSAWPSVKEAFAAGKIGVGDMYAISKLDESSQPELLALKLSGASRDVIEQAGRKSRKGNKPSVKVTRTRLPLPSGVCIVVSGQALSLDGLIESLGQAQTSAKRALARDEDIKSFQAVMTARSKKRSEIATQSQSPGLG